MRSYDLSGIPLVPGMRLVILIITAVGLFAIAVIGALWAIIMVTPACFLIGVVVFLLLRTERRQAAMLDRLTIETELQRQMNEREYAAWRTSLDDARRNADRRAQVLRKFDSSRDP